MNDLIGQAQGMATDYLGPVWGPPAFTVGKTVIAIDIVKVPAAA